MSTLEFCPLCHNLLHHNVVEDDDVSELKMECHACHHTKDVSQLTVFSDNYRQELTNNYPVHSDLCLDKTHVRTNKLKCPNGQCPSNLEESIQPEIMLFHYNSDYTQGYICCKCKSHWKNLTSEASEK